MGKQLDNIPNELKAMPNWVGFRITPKPDDSGYNKMPVRIDSGTGASSTNANSWTTFENAAEALKSKRHGINAIGFAFEGSGVCGIDLDHCIDHNGKITDFAKDVLEKVQSYTEYSPSGTGLHILAHCSKLFSGKGINRKEIEIYQGGRFFTVTGKHYGSAPTELNDCTEAVLSIYNTFTSDTTGAVCALKDDSNKVADLTEHNSIAALNASCSPSISANFSDNELIDKARNAKNGAKFDALWRGDYSGYKSQSEADLALCTSLAFWTGNDASRIDKLFQLSGLFRPKWNEKRGNMTYGENTIAKVLASSSEVYKPPEHKKKKSRATKISAVFVQDNCYCVRRGDEIKTLTNFVILPSEIIVCGDDSRITAKIVTLRGEVTERTFPISVFNSLNAFKDALCRNDMNHIVTCQETELQYIKDYVSRLPCAVKRGYKGIGIEFMEMTGGKHSPVFVCKEGAFTKNWQRHDGIVHIAGSENISSDIANTLSLDRADLEYCGKHYLNYNEKPKTLSILCYAVACFIKPHLKRHGIKFPNLILYGEHGSGKSTTFKEFLCPFFSTSGAPPIAKMTKFTLLAKAASSNCIPMAFDEYKPSTLSKSIANEIHNTMRDVYDGEHGERGNADKTVTYYEIEAPLIVMGEEAPFEPAIRERSIILQFSKADIFDKKDNLAKLAELNTMSIVFGKAMTQSFGKTVLMTALSLSSQKVRTAFMEELDGIDVNLDSRVINNIAVLLTGAWLLEQTCFAVGTSFRNVFGIEKDSIKAEIIKAVKDYTLEGIDNSKGVVENSLEVMDRMVPSVLNAGCHFKLCEDKNKIAFNFKRIYDEFTKYVKDKAIAGEFVDFRNFKAQISKKAYFIKYGTARFKTDTYAQGEGDPEGCYIFDIIKLNEYCDVGNILTQLRWTPPPPPQPKQESVFDIML